MSLSMTVSVNLDETPILILGTQILLSFQCQGAFRPTFERLPFRDRVVWVAALAFITGIRAKRPLPHEPSPEADVQQLAIVRRLGLVLSQVAHRCSAGRDHVDWSARLPSGDSLYRISEK